MFLVLPQAVPGCFHQLGSPIDWVDKTMEMNFLTGLGAGSPRSGAGQSGSWWERSSWLELAVFSLHPPGRD